MEITETNTPDKKNLKRAQLPFKTMDIKTALKASVTSSRKRKHYDTVGDNNNDAKSLKVSGSLCVKKVDKCDSVKNWEVIAINSGASQKSSKNVIVNGNQSDEFKGVKEEKQDEVMEVCENNETEEHSEKLKHISCAVNDVSDSDSVINLSSDEASSSALDNSYTNVSLNSSALSADVEVDPENKLVASPDLLSGMLEKKSDSVETKTLKHTDELLAQSDPKKSNEKSKVTAVTNGKTKTLECKDKLRKRKKMSPEEAQLKAEKRVQKQEEKVQQKLEKEKELLARKEEKKLQKEQKQQEIQKKKEERQRKKDLEEKLKVEKKEQEEKERQRKQQEKEEKNRLKQAKMEEKRKKEEQKMKALEEKKKAEEEKKKAELEQEKKNERTKAAFASFFLKGKTASPPQGSRSSSSDQGYFRPFQIKENMSVAPVVPKVAQERFDREQLEHLLSAQVGTELYLDAIRSEKHQAFRYKKVKSKKTEDSDADVVILDCKENEQAAVNLHLKAKLLQFCDNIRPPYWGTWRKRSKVVRPRNPFNKDRVFDYDVDSDDEWDEGGPGESLSGTEDEESEDDYEVDNEFFVPHGYLSPDEEKDEDDPSASDPELQRVRLKMKEREFENERNKKTTELRPSIIGCFWEMDFESGNPLSAKSLQAFCAVVLVPQPIATTFSIPKSKVDDSTSLKPDRVGLEGVSPKAPGVKRPVPEEALPYLIQLLHANTNGRQTVVKEFQEFWLLHSHTKEDSSKKGTEASVMAALSPATNEKCTLDSNQAASKMQPYKISVKQLSMTIREISEWCKCPNAALNKYCWWVHDKVREKFGFEDLPVPNKWNYVTRKEVENTLPVAQITPSIKDFLNP